jgi:aminopeptidase N
MENLAPDRLHPDWQQWEEFATSRALGASNRDIYKDVQSVSVQVNHPDEISSLFDPSIVYGKGARVLNMLYDYIGEDTFRSGLKQYFETFRYKNATRDDLWRAFGNVGKEDIEQLMTPWILQSGMPMLRVKRIDTDNIHLSQQRFLLDGEDTESLWPIPLLANTPLPQDILGTREATIAYSGKELPMFNAHGTGHYVTYYEDSETRKNLYGKVADRTVGSMERINLLNDMLLLSRHGELSLVEALELVEKCTEEPRDAVWSMLVRAISQSQVLTDGDTAAEQQIKNFKAKLSQYWYDQLGWEDQTKDDPNTKHLRTTALALSIAGERQEAIDTALTMFKTAGSAEALPAELRSLIASAAVRFGDTTVVDQLMKEYETTQNSELQESIAAALCSTRDEAVAGKLIQWGLKPKTGVIRQQDLTHWFVYLMRNFYTRQLAWDWMVGSWDYLMELFGGGKHMEYFVWYAAGALSTPDWQQKFTDFFEPKISDVAMARNIKIAINEIAARTEWRQREEANLKVYYQKHSS